MKSMSIDSWVADTSNQFFKLKHGFHKNNVVPSKTSFFGLRPICTLHSICLKLGF